MWAQGAPRAVSVSEDQSLSHGGHVGPEQREAARLDFSLLENVNGVRRFPHGVCVLSCVWLFLTWWTITRLCPWDSPGEDTGVGFHFLFQGSSWPWAHVSWASFIGRQILYLWALWEAPWVLPSSVLPVNLLWSSKRSGKCGVYNLAKSASPDSVKPVSWDSACVSGLRRNLWV